MQHQTTWVLAANGSHAKLFEMLKFPKLEEFAVLEHPESKLRSSELVSSPLGENTGMGMSGQNTYEPKSDPHHQEMDKFAKLVGERLSSSFLKGEFSRLYIIASPLFLGLLRPHLDQKILKTIVAEIHKDMTEHRISEIEEHLEETRV
jgi:protein required for attachment to host cells